jgi:hypothetical protein
VAEGREQALARRGGRGSRSRRLFELTRSCFEYEGYYATAFWPNEGCRASHTSTTSRLPLLSEHGQRPVTSSVAGLEASASGGHVRTREIFFGEEQRFRFSAR